MKVPNVPGEYAFKALVSTPDTFGWVLTEGFYFSLEQAKGLTAADNLIWPVEIREGGIVYVPSKEELESY